MRLQRIEMLAAALAAAMAAGCATVDCASGQYYGATANEVWPMTPRYDCTFGSTVDMAVARQVADKDAAARNAGKVPPMDGVASREAVDRYLKSYRAPEPNTSAFTIGVTGSQSGGAGQ